MRTNYGVFGMETMLETVGRNPEKNLPKLLSWMDCAAESDQRAVERINLFRSVLRDPESHIYRFLCDLFADIEPDVLYVVFKNMIQNALTADASPYAEQTAGVCRFPKTVLLNATRADSQSRQAAWQERPFDFNFDELDSILMQGKSCDVYGYLFGGDEPLVRKRELIAVAKKHYDCLLFLFTSGALLDAEFADELLRVKNMIPVLRTESISEANGKSGEQQSPAYVMRLLKKKKLLFGVSRLCTSQGDEESSSAAFLQQAAEWGAKLVWNVPITTDKSDPAKQSTPSCELHDARTAERTFSIRFRNTLPEIVSVDFMQ